MSLSFTNRTALGLQHWPAATLPAEGLGTQHTRQCVTSRKENTEKTLELFFSIFLLRNSTGIFAFSSALPLRLPAESVTRRFAPLKHPLPWEHQASSTTGQEHRAIPQCWMLLRGRG